MTYPISDVTRRIVYSGSAGVGPYSFAFEVLEQTDIAVYKNTSLLTLTTDYTVTINVDGTGSITLVSAATGADQITIVGDRAVARSTDFVTGGDLFANSLNDEFDSLVIFTQQVDEKADRGLKAPVTDPTDVNMELPAKATRKGTVLAFNATTGDPEAGPTIADTQSVADSIADIETVADNIADVNTVADNIADVNTVAGISGNVTTVAGISANVTTVAGISADVTTVAGISTDVTSVADGLTASTATGVAYFNGSSVFTSGSNLTFDDSTKMLTIDAPIKPILRLSGDGNNANNTVFGEIQFYNKDVSRAGPNSPATIQALSAGTFGNGGQLLFSTSPYTETTEGAAPLNRFLIDDEGNSFFYSKSGTYGSFYWDSDDTIVGISASGVAGDGGDDATLRIVAKETSQVTFTSFLGKSLKIELNETAGTGLQNAKITHSDGLSIFSGSSTSNALFYSTGNVSLSGGALRTDYATGDVTISGNLTVQGTTVTLDNASVQTFTWGDNDKAIFGDGSDLQIYHDGTTNKIDGSVTLTGNLTTTGNTTLGDASTDTVTVNGNMGVGGAGATSAGITINNAALTGATQTGINSYLVATSAATTTVRGYNSQVTTPPSTGVTDVYGYSALNPVLGSGGTVTNCHGYLVADQTRGTNNYGITSTVSSGTNKWNIYASGTAANYFAGNVGIGTNSPNEKLVIDGDTRIQNSTSDFGVLHFGSSSDVTGIIGRGSSHATLPETLQITAGGRLQYLADDINERQDFYIGNQERFRLSSTEAIFNNTGADVDFRVESDTNSHAFFLRGSDGYVGIGVSSPLSTLDVRTSTGGVLTLSTSDTSIQTATGDVLGSIQFQAPSEASGGQAILPAASISAVCEVANFNATNNDTALVFSTNATSALPVERARITSDGYLRLASGTGGIQFNGDTAAANALDDYEEGTWTPVISDGTNNATAGSNNGGSYTKVGNIVTVIAYVKTSSLGSVTGGLRITGLPFTSVNSVSAGGYASVAAGLGSDFAITAGQVVGVNAVPNATYLNVRLWDDVTGTTLMQATEWSADGQLTFSLTYKTA